MPSIDPAHVERAKQLGSMLRHHLKRTGRSLDGVAADTGYNRNYLNSMTTGTQLPAQLPLMSFLASLGMVDAHGEPTAGFHSDVARMRELAKPHPGRRPRGRTGSKKLSKVPPVPVRATREETQNQVMDLLDALGEITFEDIERFLEEHLDSITPEQRLRLVAYLVKGV